MLLQAFTGCCPLGGDLLATRQKEGDEIRSIRTNTIVSCTQEQCTTSFQEWELGLHVWGLNLANLNLANRLWRVLLQTFSLGESRQSTSSKLWFYHFFILKWKGEVDPFSFCDDDHQREFGCLTCTGFHCFSHGLPSPLKLINDLSRCCFLPWILFISFLYLLITNAVCDDIKLVLDFSSVIFQWLYCGNTVVITWEPQFWNIINKMWT